MLIYLVNIIINYFLIYSFNSIKVKNSYQNYLFLIIFVFSKISFHLLDDKMLSK